ncbi:SMa0974 family conjugal transfer regulator [Shinella sp.]|uniref:SMa0974 family conjugal transfer regulator n=1 Tax=Shinella sp. TaxID=1870904 RepID=UPI003F7077B1
MKKPTNKLIAETFVSVADANCVVDELCARCCSYCLSIGEDGFDRLLVFEGVRATLRPAADGVQMRVEGGDLISFYGVRMLLQGQLGTVIIATTAVEWKLAGRDPFRTLQRR